MKVSSRKITVAFGMICIILVAGLASGIIYFTQLIKEKDDAITSLNAQITNKDNTISSLQKQLSSKESEISQLQNNIRNLQSDKDSLTSQVTSLNGQVANLSLQISELQSRNAEYLKILRLEEEEILDFERQINIPAGSSSPSLSYLIAYPGIITIEFSATSNVYFVVHIDYKTEFFPNVNVTYRYPESGAYSSGIFAFPALPAWATFQIVNPSSTSGVSVMITVKFTY